jgi:hypothetical protein
VSVAWVNVGLGGFSRRGRVVSGLDLGSSLLGSLVLDGKEAVLQVAFLSPQLILFALLATRLASASRQSEKAISALQTTLKSLVWGACSWWKRCRIEGAGLLNFLNIEG